MTEQIKIEDLKKEIKKLQKAVNEIRNYGIRPKVLNLLIQKSAGVATYNKPVPIQHIELILEGIGNLEEYVFGEDPVNIA